MKTSDTCNVEKHLKNAMMTLVWPYVGLGVILKILNFLGEKGYFTCLRNFGTHCILGPDLVDSRFVNFLPSLVKNGYNQTWDFCWESP